MINDKRETSNQSIKLSSTHAVWDGRIWWVISIDKDKQGSTQQSQPRSQSRVPGYPRVPPELDTLMVESAIYQSDSSLQLVVFRP